jgi:hypothetical protein
MIAAAPTKVPATPTDVPSVAVAPSPRPTTGNAMPNAGPRAGEHSANRASR